MSERLVEFLYILARDELAIGAIEDIMWDHVTGCETEYCNVWLEGWARDLAERLTNDEIPITNYNNMLKHPGLDGHNARVTGEEAKLHDKIRPPYPVRTEVVYSDTV